MNRRMATHALARATALLPLAAAALAQDASCRDSDAVIGAVLQSAISQAGSHHVGLLRAPCLLAASGGVNTGDDPRRYGPGVAHGHAGSLERTSRHP